jgi:hypothetical protein
VGANVLGRPPYDRFMRRVAAVVAVALVVSATCAGGALAQGGPTTGWDGTNPFNCVLQFAGFNGLGPNPEADPYCIEFDKRRQNVTQLGVVEFMSKEPERVAAASPKCFYFQSDHWRGSVVQDDPATKTYEWDGHYYFDKAKGEGGVWVSNFNFNGRTEDPGRLPGMPQEYARYFGPGTGGFRNKGSVEADPRCAERARREGNRIYRGGAAAPRCSVAGGAVTANRLGPVRIGDTESDVRRTLGPPGEIRRGFLRYCLTTGGRYVVGQHEDRSGHFGEGSAERTAMIVGTNRAYRYRRVGPGTTLRAMKRRLRRSRFAFRYGNTRLYVARRGSAVLFGVRRKRVQFIAVRDRVTVKGKRGVEEMLRRAA